MQAEKQPAAPTPLHTAPADPSDPIIAHWRGLAHGNGLKAEEIEFTTTDSRQAPVIVSLDLALIPQRRIARQPGPPQGAATRLNSTAELAGAESMAINAAMRSPALQKAMERLGGLGEVGDKTEALPALTTSYYAVTACPTCHGRRLADCPDCRQGRIDCAACRGDGTLICSGCHGGGTISGGDGQAQMCFQCNGRGRLDCRSCGGEGRLLCPRCQGRAELPCPPCAGSGEMADIATVALTLQTKQAIDLSGLPDKLRPALEKWPPKQLMQLVELDEGGPQPADENAMPQPGRLSLKQEGRLLLTRGKLTAGTKTFPLTLLGPQGRPLTTPAFLDAPLAPILQALATAAGAAPRPARIAALREALLCRLVLEAAQASIRGQSPEKMLAEAYRGALSAETRARVARDLGKALSALTAGKRAAGGVLAVLVIGPLCALPALLPLPEGVPVWTPAAVMPLFALLLARLWQKSATRRGLADPSLGLPPQLAEVRPAAGVGGWVLAGLAAAVTCGLCLARIYL